MGDDLSLFDKRMRWPAVISVVAGLTLGVFAVIAHRMRTGSEASLLIAIPLGALAALALFLVSYRNLSAQ